MRRHIGISISRRNLAVAGLIYRGRTPQLAYSAQWPRLSRTPIDEVLGSVLKSVPAEWRDAHVRIALSNADLACGDCFQVPYRSEREVEEIAGSLAESRCAGSTSEELAIDVRLISTSADGSLVDLIALPQQNLAKIRAQIKQHFPASKLDFVSSAPSLLARALRDAAKVSKFVFADAGEAAEFHFNQASISSWRWFPVDRGLGSLAPETSAIELRENLAVPTPYAVAAAAAMAEAGQGANLLRAAPDAPKNVFTLLRKPLLLSASAAIVAILVSGIYLDRLTKNLRSEIALVEKQESTLWRESLPAENYRPGQLASRMKQVLSQRNKTADANRFPSALALWSEVAAVFPNPEPLGLSLESLQLGPDGGRMNGRVKRGVRDPLSNAAGLESALNQSTSLAARGEFETKDSDVVVRMRLDYRTPAVPPREALPK